MSNRCPGVKAYDARLVGLQERYRSAGVSIVGVNPIDEHLYPAESPADMAVAAEERGLNFPYLKDADQALARRLGASCTPHVFVLDARRRLRYRGRIDDSFIPARVTRPFLEEAIQDLLAGRHVRVAETPPLGCSLDLQLPGEPGPHPGDGGPAPAPRPSRRPESA